MRPIIRFGFACANLSILLLFITPFIPFINNARAELESAVDTQLKKAVVDYQAKLGEMQSWQKMVFQEEVMPQYRRFVLDYRAENGGVIVRIDEGSLKNFITFYAPSIFNKKDPKITVVLKPDAGCSTCLASSDAVKNLVKSYLERRGFLIDWNGNESTAGVIPAGSLGIMVVQWSLIRSDAGESAHADEQRFLLETALNLQGFPPQKRQKELLEQDTFDAAAITILTELMTELGEKSELVSERQLAEKLSGDEILIELKGIKNFNQAQKIKDGLQERFKDTASLGFRRFAKGEVSLFVGTRLSKDEIRSKLVDFPLNTAPSSGSATPDIPHVTMEIP